MLSKWFFQQQFQSHPLLSLRASVCSLQYPHIGCCMPNRTITFFALNPGFYQQGNWAHAGASTQPYKPYPQIPTTLVFWDTAPADIPTNPTPEWINKHTVQYTMDTYEKSLSYDQGYFTKKVLQAKAISRDKQIGSIFGEIPMNICRYNPAKDSGKGNTIWLHSNLTNSYNPPTTDKDVQIDNLPIWMALWGWLSWVQHQKGTPDFFISYTLCIKSPAIEIASKGTTIFPVIPIDQTFVNGMAPYGQTLTVGDKAHWYPDIYNQAEIINALVTAGPYVPKLDNIKNSTWELHYFYDFLFKWEALNHLIPQWQTLQNNPSMMPSINSNKQYKLGIQQTKI